MKYDPNSIPQMKQLRREFTHSRGELRHARKNYLGVWRRYVGDRYEESSDQRQTYLQSMKLAFGILRRQLVADEIKTLVSVASPKYMPAGEQLRLGLNDELKRMDLASKMADMVSSALAGMGIMWVGIDEYHFEGNVTGRLSAVPVDFMDWTHDMWCRSLHDGCYFMGHRVRLSYEEALDNPLFDHDAVREIRDSAVDQYEGYDSSMDELGGRWSRMEPDDRKFLQFDSIWLPRQNLTVGLPVDGSPMHLHEPIDGDSSVYRPMGPYHVLAYDRVPNRVLSSPPSDSMVYFHDLMNSLFRKMAEDARNEKKVFMYRPGSEKDAQRIKNARNLDMIATLTPDAVGEVSFNGVSSQTVGAFLQTQRLFNYMNGGLDQLGGLGSSVDTVGQAQILQQQSSALVDRMKSTTITVLRGICEHIAHYLWIDEMWRPEIPWYAQNIGPQSSRFEMDERMIPFEKLRIEVAPYSPGIATPERKFQALQILNTQVIPAAMQLAQTGLVDLPRMIKYAARLLNLEETEDLYNLIDPTQMPGPENSPMRMDSGGMSGQDNGARHYVRHSVSGQTPEARDQEMVNNFSAGGA